MKTSNEIPPLKESVRLFKRLMLLVRTYWTSIIKGLSLGVVVGIIGMASPYLTKLLIDEVYPSQDISLMHVLVGGILAISITSSLIGAVQGYFNLYVHGRLSSSLSLMFFNHLQHLKVRFFDEHRVGEIMSRFKDVNSSLNTVTNFLQTIFVNGIYLLIVPPFLFLLHWKLALVSLISIPITVIIIALSGRVLRKYWKQSSEAYAELNAYQVEMLTHIRNVKTLVLEPYVYSSAKGQIKDALNLQLKAGGLGQLVGLSNGILRALNTVLFTWLGWTYILGQEMSLGDYIAFTAYIGYLYNPISQFVSLFSDFQQSAVNLNRMFEYLDSPAEIEPSLVYKVNKSQLQNISGNIEIIDVSFGYTKNKNVLDNINLDISPGTITALIGPSGSGKTSLIRLLVRMEDPGEGNILIDGRSICQIPIRELRKQISVVWQEFSMFKGTIWENLTIGSENVSQIEVDEAVGICRMDEHIRTLPDRYETNISEWGSTLSGGQRQRLAIARALIRNTPILILDEATSNIDIKAEGEILNDIFIKYKDKTIIFITHRTTATYLADQIVILDNGHIVERGKHEELLIKSKIYRDMNLLNEIDKDGKQILKQKVI